MREEIRVGIHQPNFFPWIGYFYKMKMSDVFIILDTVNIELGSAKAITHRSQVKSNGGKGVWLTTPIDKTSTKIIKDIQISESKEWKGKVLDTIFQYYKKAPFFEEIFDFLKICFLIDEDNLSTYNTKIIKLLAKQFKITTDIILASELNVISEDRNTRLIELIQKVNGTIYLSGKGGKNYHDEHLFEENNIQIECLNFEPPIYPQLHGNFIQGLGIIDYLMNNGFKNIIQ